MGLVEEEHELRLLRIADLWQTIEELRQEPHEERRVELGPLVERFGGENVDDAATRGVGLYEVFDVERRLPEYLLAALLLEREDPALDCADRCGGDVAVLSGERLRVVAHVLDKRA